MQKSAGQQYQSINTQTGVVDADPHRLIQMLFSGALDKISIAKGCIQRDDVAGKGEAIGKAIGIVGGLRDSVRPVGDDGLADNLSSLYEFVTNRLTFANLQADVNALDESAKILKELQAGWDAIRTDAVKNLKQREGATA